MFNLERIFFFLLLSLKMLNCDLYDFRFTLCIECHIHKSRSLRVVFDFVIFVQRIFGEDRNHISIDQCIHKKRERSNTRRVNDNEHTNQPLCKTLF